MVDRIDGPAAVQDGREEYQRVWDRLQAEGPRVVWDLGFRIWCEARGARPAQTEQQPRYGRYKTQPAESVAGIAMRQLGDESRWVEIRDLNAHAFPNIGPHDYYPVGTVLTMPAAPIAQTEQSILSAGQRLYDELRQWLATEHDPDSQAALQAWREAIAQTTPQVALATRVAKLEAELGRQHEAHRKTWRQLEQAQLKLAALKGGRADG